MPSWLAGKTPGQCTLLLSQLPCTVHLLPSQQVWPAASRCLPHVSSDATEWVPPAVTTHYSTYLPGVCGHRSDNFYSSLKDKDSNLVDKRRLSSLLMCEGAGAWCWSFFFLPFTLSASGNLAVLISFKGLCSQGLYHTAEVTADDSKLWMRRSFGHCLWCHSCWQSWALQRVPSIASIIIMLQQWMTLSLSLLKRMVL